MLASVVIITASIIEYFFQSHKNFINNY